MTNFNYSLLSKNKKNYIIAEVGVNHECSLENAKKLIIHAKKNGAHAVKFQTYKAETLASPKSKAYWDLKKEKTKSQFELFKKYDKFEINDYKKLSIFCNKINIDFLSTPFDLDSVDFLNPLVKLFKVSSSDITNTPLLRKISSKGKPVILSTGASNLKEIKYAIKNLQFVKNIKIILMHCILNYPTLDNNANLLMIKHLKKNFRNYIIGYSDHTLPSKDMLNISVAYLLGANVIEKHFTLNKRKKGNDHYHSMDPRDLKNLSYNLNRIDNVCGKSKTKNFISSEKISRRNARRGIFLKKNILKGQRIRVNDIITLRPNIGIPAEAWDKVINKKVVKNAKKGSELTWKHIK